jgi:hypothetical protein
MAASSQHIADRDTSRTRCVGVLLLRSCCALHGCRAHASSTDSPPPAASSSVVAASWVPPRPTTWRNLAWPQPWLSARLSLLPHQVHDMTKKPTLC